METEERRESLQEAKNGKLSGYAPIDSSAVFLFGHGNACIH